MKNFIVYNLDGKILRAGNCQNSTFFLQAKDGEFVKEGIADDVTQKIANPGINGKVINKILEEIKAEKPPEVPFEKQPARITNEQWQEMQDRISNLEK